MEIFLDVVFFIFIFSILIQFFFGFFFVRLSFYKNKRSKFSEGVSVIICAKNEDENLAKNLISILEQDYPDYEVIVVNDQSIDGTKYILQDLQKKYSHLEVVTIEDHVNSRLGKKFPLTIGIKTSKFDYILLTDADCYVDSKYWINNMCSQFEYKDIILGLSIFHKHNSILNRLIRFDDFQVSLQYLSFALVGIPYMGVGRNLSYKKSLFFKVKGFASHIHIPSGDDDLFIKEVATKENVSIRINDKSIVTSIAKDSFFSWIYQKRRHFSTVHLYSLKHKILLFIWPLSQFLFWSTSILLFLFSCNIIILSLFLFRIVFYYFLYFKSMKKLKAFDLYFIYPLLEFLYILIQLFFVLLNPSYKSNRWK